MRISLGHNGISETLVHEESGSLITEEVQDCTAVLDRAQILRGLSVNRRAHMKPAATIPLVIYHNWKKEWRTQYRQSWTWQTYLAMKINSRDYSKLRTSDMKL
jgi:hypothetical protein